MFSCLELYLHFKYTIYMSDTASVKALKIVSAVLVGLVILIILAFIGKIVFFIGVGAVLIGLGVWMYFVLRPQKVEQVKPIIKPVPQVIQEAKPEIKQIATRLGLKYNTSDPSIQKLFNATNGFIDATQKEMCALIMANLKELTDEVTASFNGQEVPCSTLSDAYAEIKKDPGFQEVPAGIVKELDNVVAALMEAVCTPSGNMNAQKLTDFINALASALCGK